MIKVLFLGDVVAKGGRRGIEKFLPVLKQKYKFDLVIVNGENAAGGIGLTIKVAEEIFSYGIDIITSGNHIWKHKELKDYLDRNKYRLTRPLNYPDHRDYSTPGTGSLSYSIGRELPEIVIVNLLGRIFMEPVDCPFRKIDEFLDGAGLENKIIIVDFHAEATSEKIAMGFYLDGRVAAVLGTHTHVQTADNRILPRGTAYISDAGMCGSRDSVIGGDKNIILQKFLTQRPVSFKFPSEDVGINGVIIEIDETTLKARSIERVSMYD